VKARTSAEHVSEAVIRATEHWSARKQARAGGKSECACTIALSRETGSRGTSVARELGRRLGWPVYDQELLKLIAQEMNLREALVQSVDEKHISWLREAVAALALEPVVSESAYVVQLIETVLSLGKHGQCVVVGRGAPFILPAETTVRIRLVAPLPDRIAFMRQELGLSEAEAKKRVRDTDRDRENFVKEYFRQDATLASNYDLLLNTVRYNVTQCAVIIEAALQQRQAHLANAK
jgi:cytidylate kinase